MKPEHLDALESFYESCQTAPIPQALLGNLLPTPWWHRGLVPLTGLSMGGLMAIFILLAPSQPSQEASVQAALALTQTQIRSTAEVATILHSRSEEVIKWRA